MPVHPQVQTILDAMAQMGGPELADLSPPEAREMYKALSAVEQGEEVLRVDDRHIPTEDGDLPVRVYTPEESVGANHGAFLWFHGGGWTIGDLDTADHTCRALANGSGAVVVSVDYRLAPEHPAPAALDDVMAALTWTAENAELLGADVSRLAVGGDSAGGHLAAQLCQRSLREFGPDIDFQLLVYPVTDLSLSHPSIEENAEGYFLTKRSMEWFRANYIGDLDPRDPALSPLFAPDLAGLPAALVITAEYDPLRDEGEAYAQRLQESGVPTQLVRYDGQIHGFFAMPTMLEDGRHAVGLASAALRSVLT